MGVLSDYEPKLALKFFEEICSIPHGSGNTRMISDYLVEFAESRQLKYYRDEANNVIIYKAASKGYEDSLPVIIQGHMDMVCEKSEDSDIDFDKDGLRLKIDDDIIYAQGTTLGGDDGVAVAFALAILDDDELMHPRIEAVFTVDEEIGMLGASALDMSKLSAGLMINLDSESEGEILASCAGGVTAKCHLPISRCAVKGTRVSVEVSGLLGGHSGEEINKQRANSNQLMGRVLYNLHKEIEFNLISVNGGLKDNAIPRKTTAELVLISGDDFDMLSQIVKDVRSDINSEYRETDPDITISAIMKPQSECSNVSGIAPDDEESLECVKDKAGKVIGKVEEIEAMDKVSTLNTIVSLSTLPYGVQRMSRDIENLVQTSLNMGILTSNETELNLIFSVRSSVYTEKKELCEKLEAAMELVGGSVEYSGAYPAWEYRKQSQLRDIMIKLHEEMFGYAPKVTAIHAGLECGIFSSALEGLDCVSIGPDICDIHTFAEHMNVKSVKRSWDYLIEILKALK